MRKLSQICGLVAGSMMLVGLTANCSSASEKKSGDSGVYIDSPADMTVDSSVKLDSAQNDLNQITDDESAVDKEEIKKRIKHIWFELPPSLLMRKINTDNPAFEKRVWKVMTKSMGDKFSEGMKAYRQADDDGDVLDIAESLFGFWGAQDPDPNGKLSFTDISVKAPDRIEAKVSYKNYTDPETHSLILKKINGEWLLDDFDNFKAITF